MADVSSQGDVKRCLGCFTEDKALKPRLGVGRPGWSGDGELPFRVNEQNVPAPEKREGSAASGAVPSVVPSPLLILVLIPLHAFLNI